MPGYVIPTRPPSDPHDAEWIFETIVLEIADREGVDPLELPEPLYDTINPDAVESLFRGSPGFLTFDYLGYSVTVTHERDVIIADRDAE